MLQLSPVFPHRLEKNNFCNLEFFFLQNFCLVSVQTANWRKTWEDSSIEYTNLHSTYFQQKLWMTGFFMLSLHIFGNKWCLLIISHFFVLFCIRSFFWGKSSTKSGGFHISRVFLFYTVTKQYLVILQTYFSLILLLNLKVGTYPNQVHIEIATF